MGVLVRPGRRQGDARRRSAARSPSSKSLKALLKLKPDVVVEAASQQAVRDWGETILKKGIDLMVIATGAYGDPKLYKKHIKAAEKSGARLRLPSGAIAGLDGLLAMRLGKLERVKYVSIKPPHAWSGTPAETEFDLPSIKDADGDLPRQAGRCRPALSEERQSRGDGGAVRRRPRAHRHRAGGRSHPAGRHQCQPPRDRGRFGRDQPASGSAAAMPDNPKTGVLTALTMADDLMKMVRASDWRQPLIPFHTPLPLSGGEEHEMRQRLYRRP